MLRRQDMHHQPVMRTFLRNVPTGLYVQSRESWTGNLEEACDFKTMSQAIRYVEERGLRQMELAFVSPDDSRCTEVPLDLLAWGASVSKGTDRAVA